jgi:hypothetical protein
MARSLGDESLWRILDPDAATLHRIATDGGLGKSFWHELLICV